MTAPSALVLVAGLATVGGALVAVTGRDVRHALTGLVVSMAAASLVVDPLPSPAGIGTRIVAVLLGGYLLSIALRAGSTVARGSLAGRSAESFAAAAAFVVGFGSSGLGATALGPPVAQGVGFALLVLAIGPVVRATDIYRLGVGLALLLTGAALVRVGLAGTPGPLEQLAMAGLTVGLLGSVAILRAGAASASGALTIEDGSATKTRFDAHPIVAAETKVGRPRSVARTSVHPAGHRRANLGRGRPTPVDRDGSDAELGP